MIKNKVKLKLNKVKTCAVITAISFMISTFGANLYAIPMSEYANKEYEEIFNKVNGISLEYGKITSSKDEGSDITVINIQDLHCHLQTQRNISRIISQIAEKYNLKSVYIEGGYGEIDTSWIEQIKEEQIKKQVIEKMLEEGILTGGEYYKLTSDKNAIDLKGMDEEQLHKDNIKRLSWIIANQDKYKEVIEKVNKEINILEQIYVNNRNKRFNKDIEKYLSNKIDTKKFYGQLIKYINDINANPDKYNNITAIRLEDYPNIITFLSMSKNSKDIDIKQAKLELQKIIILLKNKLPYFVYSQLLKTTNQFSDNQKTLQLINLLCKKEGISLNKNFKEVVKLSNLNLNNKNFNPILLVQEEKELIEQIRRALSYNDEEYEITYVKDFIKYFDNYLKYKLTEEDWKYFKNGYNSFRQLYSKYAVTDRIKNIENDFLEINKYYEINNIRNEIFVRNLLEEKHPQPVNKKNRKSEEILKDSQEVIIAITGGFHSGALEELLSKKQVNTITITPSIYDNSELANKKYIKTIIEQGKINSQALAYTLASCATDTNKQQLLMAVLKELEQQNPEITKKVLGKDIDFSQQNKIELYKQETKKTKELIETTINQILKILPKDGFKELLIPNIDEIMLNLITQLVENGIHFSKGTIYEIENSKLNGQILNGIPAEIYSRIMPSLQMALLKISTKEETDTTEISINEEDIQEDINILYEDTGADGYINIYLEDIKENSESFLEQIEFAIKNNKLIVLNLFRTHIDIEKLNGEEQIKLYQDIHSLFLKLFLDQPLYNFISLPENRSFMRYDIHFFLVEILKNAFFHGNKGLDKPIFIYMNLNERNEIKILSIYNKNSLEDDTFQIRALRMKLALLGGQHKGSILMKQNPHRTFGTEDNFRDKFYKVTSFIKSSYDENSAKWLQKNIHQINYFSIFENLKTKTLFKVLNIAAPVWEEIVFRAVPTIISVALISLPFANFITIPLSVMIFAIFQKQFINAHIVTDWLKTKDSGWIDSLSTKDILKFSLLGIFSNKETKNEFKQYLKIEETKQYITSLIKPTILLSGIYLITLLTSLTNPILISTIVAIIIHSTINSNIELLNILKPINIDEQLNKTNIDKNFINLATKHGANFISIYDLKSKIKQLKKYNKRKPIPVNRYFSPIHKQIWQQKQNFVTSSIGFSLGLTNVNLFENNKVNLIQPISESNNLISWERGYEYFYGNSYLDDKIVTVEEYVKQIISSSIKSDKHIFFFLPGDFENLDTKTKREFDYIQSLINNSPELANYFTFVVGVYDCFDIQNQKIFDNNFNEKNIYKTLNKLLSFPKIFIKGNILSKIFSHTSKLSIFSENVPISLHSENVNFSNEELNTLNKDTDTVGYVDIYLDDDVEITKTNILNAAQTNKFIVLHMFRDIASLKTKNLKEIYGAIRSYISKLFDDISALNTVFPNMVEKEIDYQGFRYGYNFFLKEIIKNAFIHGNYGLLDQPIGLAIKLNDNQEVEKISIYSKNVAQRYFDEQRFEATSYAGLSGYHLGGKLMELSYLRDYTEEPNFNDGQFFKTTSTIKEDVDSKRLSKFDVFLSFTSKFHPFPSGNNKKEEISSPQTKYFDQYFKDKEVVVSNVNTGDYNILSFTKNKVFRSGRNPELISEKQQFDSIGIIVEFYGNGDIRSVKAKEGFEFTGISLDGKPVGREENNKPFSQEKLDTMLKDTGASGYVDIFLDDEETILRKNILTAIQTNKLMVVHIFRKNFDENKLTLGQLYKKYQEVYSLMQSDKLQFIFPQTAIEDKNKEKESIIHADFFLKELTKINFAHGLRGAFGYPFAWYIQTNSQDVVSKIITYNAGSIVDSKLIDVLKNLMNDAGIFEDTNAIKIMNRSLLRNLKAGTIQLNGISFFKAESVLKTPEEQEQVSINYEKQQEMLEDFQGSSGILPEHIGLLNEMLQEGKSAIISAMKIAFKEFRASLSSDFVERHHSVQGKKGAQELRDFITKYDAVEGEGIVKRIIKGILSKLVKGASIIKHIIIDYRYIKESGIEQAIQMFGNKTYIDENGQIHIPPVLILENLENISEKYELKNTGIKVQGTSIYQLVINGVLVYGAQGIEGSQVSKAINTSGMLKEEIERLLKTKGIERVKVEVEGIIVEQAEGLRFEEGITVIGSQELQGQSTEYINGYVNSSVEIKRSMGLMYSQKALISLESIKEAEPLKQALKHARARKVISKEQYEKIGLSKEEIMIMREEGIEIYIEDNEIKREYQEKGINGQIIKEIDKSYIYDYYTQEKLEIEELPEGATVLEIENMLLNSDKPIKVGINVLTQAFKRADILSSYTGLDTLIGKMKFTIGIVKLTQRDMQSMVNNIDYNKIPVIEESRYKELKESKLEEVKEILNIEDNSELGILIKTVLKNEEIENEQINKKIKERVLAKSALKQVNKENGLKDKKLEEMLGRMLLIQIDNKDKQTINIEGSFKASKEELIKKIMQETIKAEEKNEIAINTIIEIILVYADEYKNKQLTRRADTNDARNYRAMLSAA